ncbi:MAG: hypothetical protein UX42_C0007G0011 [Microgenomates group bacterium GW2011_GWC1_46_20]|nr:MAG: hypothetical protein UX42_C0007G0011 [Microgenomates group bacterium GW2011_GWC1_46_20]
MAGAGLVRKSIHILWEGFGDVGGAAGAEGESGVERYIFDIAVEDTAAGRTGT